VGVVAFLKKKMLIGSTTTNKLHILVLRCFSSWINWNRTV